MFKKSNKKAFTLIELIVVMAVIGVLVLLAMPKFMGYTKEAKFTKLISNAKQLENASERYYMNKENWPRVSDTPYTAQQVEAFAQKIYDTTGKEIILDSGGQYYDIDYSKLNKYISIPDNKEQYIIQNPVGNVYALDGLTKEASKRFESQTPLNNKPVAFITMTPNSNITTNTNIVWSYENSTDPDGDEISNVEWQNKQDKYINEGIYTVKLRVQDSKGLWSNWAEKTFTVNNDYALYFDGINNYVSIPHSDSLGIAQSITIDLDVKVSSYKNDYMSLLFKGNGANTLRDYTIWVHNMGSFLASMLNVDHTQSNTPYGYIRLNEWHKLTLVVDRVAGVSSWYDNGQLVSSVSISTTNNSITTNPLLIGSTQESRSYYSKFNGYLDNIRIWNYAKTQSQIQSDLDKELTGQESGLVASWDFNEGTDNTVNDKSPNNNDGTIYGEANWVLR